MTEQELQDKATFYTSRARAADVPSHCIDGLVRYIVHGIETGSFLAAVLSNDLKGAVERSDHINGPALPQYVRFLYSSAPAGCWGSPENVKGWLAHRGLAGIGADTTGSAPTWRDPQDWGGLEPPATEGTYVALMVDFGGGEYETKGAAYPTGDGRVIYADEGGWCTTSVTKWRPLTPNA